MVVVVVVKNFKHVHDFFFLSKVQESKERIFFYDSNIDKTDGQNPRKERKKNFKMKNKKKQTV